LPLLELFKRFRALPGFLSRYRWFGPLLGGLVGFLGGIAGALIGLILGYFIQELFRQLHTDGAVLRYLENPGRPGFYEGEPGLAAYCALGIILVSKSVYPGPGRSMDGGFLLDRVAGSAVSAFPRGRAELPRIESFCRLALSRREVLNPDLLVESLAARRISLGDLPKLGEELAALASGDAALREAEYIRSVLDPAYQPSDSGSAGDTGKPAADPWRVLGLESGASLAEVKSSFRQLAVQFHPDVLQALDKEHQENAARAFITIKEAYREIMRSGVKGEE
jgi:DnaJ like chaperone protein